MSPPELSLHLPELSDAPWVSECYAPYVLETCISFEDKAPSAVEMARRMMQHRSTHPFLLLREGGERVAYAYAGPHRSRAAYQWSVEVSVYVHRDHHRRGFGRLLYETLFALLRRQGYQRVYAGITLPNPGSVGLHEAMGMRPVGVYERVGFKAGQWHDVGWWQADLVPPRTGELVPPRPFDAADLGALDIRSPQV